MKHFLLFDIDGTILYLKKRISRILFSGLIKKMFGREIAFEAMPDFAGMTDLQILKEIADKAEIDQNSLDKSISDIWKNLTADFAPYCTKEYVALLPGVKKLIENLHERNDVKLGLLTGNFREHAFLKLKAHELDKYFDTGAFGSDHENRNMLPPIALERANKLVNGDEEFSEKNSLIIGDTPRDIECARTNHMPVLAVSTGVFPKEELIKHKPDKLLTDFSDINFTIETIFNLLKSR